MRVDLTCVRRQVDELTAIDQHRFPGRLSDDLRTIFQARN